jgi:hypothetical protein
MMLKNFEKTLVTQKLISQIHDLLNNYVRLRITSSIGIHFQKQIFSKIVKNFFFLFCSDFGSASLKGQWMM